MFPPVFSCAGRRGYSSLQGIGSDASYNPSSGGYGGGVGGGGMNAEEIGGQIGQIGQKSMRFLSESFATLQTGVKASCWAKRCTELALSTG